MKELTSKPSAPAPNLRMHKFTCKTMQGTGGVHHSHTNWMQTMTLHQVYPPSYADRGR